MIDKDGRNFNELNNVDVEQNDDNSASVIELNDENGRNFNECNVIAEQNDDDSASVSKLNITYKDCSNFA